MSSDYAWLVPVITATASLLGAIVGGLATYWTSKVAHERATAAERAAQRNTLLREAAMRFVAGMTGMGEMAEQSSVLKRMTQQLGPVADELTAASTEEELFRVAKKIDPTIEAGGSRTKILTQLVRATGVYDEVVRHRFTLLTELRLIAPKDVADSAQRVLYRAFAQEMMGLVAPHLQRRATDAFNDEMSDFVNYVRHHMNVEDIEFEFINEEVMQQVLEMGN
ncbi:hypothetical protein BHQ23_26595 [Mycobacterium gordonae]|uniref:Uncharacterized protein n=2 Tax=Mycobacterium gordonae TaxID=1778 RepID=A0A1X1VNE9_MYCGO|nr:hypothetical protein BHQ23_26595 [Mycobacterium gordonae]ORV70566.1 hypothetical protein AWC08_05230 [Mycobacterium gordonae]